jgi:hypothetical protein
MQEPHQPTLARRPTPVNTRRRWRQTACAEQLWPERHVGRPDQRCGVAISRLADDATDTLEQSDELRIDWFSRRRALCRRGR